jgi:hypothetical protein
MGKLQDRIKEAARLWGLPQHLNSKIEFGEKDGMAVQMMEARQGNSAAFRGILRWGTADRDALVRERLKNSEQLKEAKIKPGQVKIENGMAVYTLPFSFSFGIPEARQLVKRMQALVNEIKLAVGEISLGCLNCGTDVSQPVLINGVVGRICAACQEKARVEARRLSEAYDAIPTRWVRAVVVGTILMIVGAVVWDASMIYLKRMYWVLAIGIGIAIGWATTKAAGKGGLGVQVMSGVLTVVSVVGGMLVLFAVAALGQSLDKDTVDSAVFSANFSAILSSAAGDLAFAGIGSLIGAVAAARRAGRPSFEVAVEK